jgi:hypothetical protein
MPILCILLEVPNIGPKNLVLSFFPTLVTLVSLPKMGYSQNIAFEEDVPFEKPSSYWGSPIL